MSIKSPTSLLLNNTRPLHKLILSISAAWVMSTTLPVFAAEQEWWFDVEVILFDRQLSPEEVTENFKQSRLVPSTANDLLTPYLTPDMTYMRAGLDYCRASNQQQKQQQAQQKLQLATVQDILDLAQKLAQQTITDQTLITSLDPAPEQQPSTKSTSNKSATASIENPALDGSGSNVQISEDGQVITSESPSPSNEQPAPIDISINWLEWQMPNQLPCAYVEQIEPRLMVELDQEKEQNQQDVLAHIQTVPVQIDGIEWQTKRPAFLLPQANTRMADLFASIKNQKGISPLLHKVWRQQVVFGSDKAEPVRLFAGQNYAKEFDGNGQLKPVENNQPSENMPVDTLYLPSQERAKMSEQEYQNWLASHSLDDTNLVEQNEQLFTEIKQALSNSKGVTGLIPTNDLLIENSNNNEVAEVKQLWTIDGHIKVYLKYVGRVPYLLIDSDLDYRRPIPAEIDGSNNVTEVNNGVNRSTPLLTASAPSYTLQSANFKQLRRVISKQVHYFDHPLFGMIVRLHRYQWPKIEQENTDTSNQE